MQINVPSALVGAGVAALAFFAFGFQTFTVTPINPPVVIEGIPLARDMISIGDDVTPTAFQVHTIFDVPPDKILVVTYWHAQPVFSNEMEMLQDLGGVLTPKLDKRILEGEFNYGTTTGLTFDPGSKAILRNPDDDTAHRVVYMLVGYLADA